MIFKKQIKVSLQVYQDDNKLKTFKKIYEMIDCIKNNDENNCKKICTKDYNSDE